MRIVLDLDVSRDGALRRMADVIDDETVSIVLPPHVVLRQRSSIVCPKRFVEQQMAILCICRGYAWTMFNPLKDERLEKKPLPMEGLSS